MAVGLASDRIGKPRYAARMQWRAAAGKPRHGQVETAPEQVHGTDLAEEAGTKALQHPVHRHAGAEEARHRLGIIGSVGMVVGKGNRIGKLVGGAMKLGAAAEPYQHVAETRVEAGHRARREAELRRAAIAVGAEQLVIDQVECQFDAAHAVGDDAGREAARIDIEAGLPGMVDPRRAGQAVFADNLRIEMQRRTGIAPRRIGNLRPGRIHAAFPCWNCGQPERLTGRRQRRMTYSLRVVSSTSQLPLKPGLSTKLSPARSVQVLPVSSTITETPGQDMAELPLVVFDSPHAGRRLPDPGIEAALRLLDIPGAEFRIAGQQPLGARRALLRLDRIDIDLQELAGLHLLVLHAKAPDR